MEGYKKTQARDHQGNILFLETMSDMVRETPDRRFVDNIEKRLLNKVSSNEDSLDFFFEQVDALKAISSQEQRLLTLLDTYPTDMNDQLAILESLAPLREYVSQLIGNIDAEPIVYSGSSNKKYKLGVDDKDPQNPKLIFMEIIGELGQPEHYTVGDIWDVPVSAPNVRIDITPTLVAFDNKRKTVLTYAQGKQLEGVSETQLANIINSTQVEEVKAEGENIPQAFVSFDIKSQLALIFGNKSLENTIKSLTLSILSKPTGSSTYALTQGFMSGNVVQPIREAYQASDYTTNNFQNITWTDSIDQTFLTSWMNSDGTAAVITYGAAASSVSISRPTLSIYIKNPYLGKKLVAVKDMGNEFNILDWEEYSE